MEVDEAGLRVRPANKRCTVILREIPQDTRVEVIYIGVFMPFLLKILYFDSTCIWLKIDCLPKYLLKVKDDCVSWLVTHFNENCVSRGLSMSVCGSPHDKTKTAKTTITKLVTAIVHDESLLPI